MSINNEESFRRETMAKAVESTLEQFRTPPNGGPRVPHHRSDRMEIEEMRSALKDELLEGARWRREKAIQFPNDDRNVPAAEALERVASTVDNVPDEIVRQYAEAWKPENSTTTSEIQSVLMRDIGFRSSTNTATMLIQHVLELVADAGADADLG